MNDGIRGVLWNALKSMLKINFSRDGICSFILKCPKFEHFQFLSLFCSNSHHVLFFWNARFLFVRLFWNAQFSIHSARKVLNLFENWAFQNKRTNKNRAFQKKSTWWEFEQKRERNWKCSNFGHFKINEHMPSREKFIFHMLFRAFYNTPRIRYWKL